MVAQPYKSPHGSYTPEPPQFAGKFVNPANTPGSHCFNFELGASHRLPLTINPHHLKYPPLKTVNSSRQHRNQLNTLDTGYLTKLL